MTVFEIIIEAAFIMVMLGVAFAFFRLLKGPSLPDRIVALDMMTVLIVAFCGLYAIRSNDTAFVDVAIVVAIIGFLATVALARFVERRTEREGGQAARSAEVVPRAEQEDAP